VLRAVILLVLTLPLHAALPRIPELPSSGFPSTAAGEAFARSVLASAKPAELEARLVADPEAVPSVLRHLASSLMTTDETLREEVTRYQREVIAAHAKRIDKQFDDNDVRLLVSLAVVDPIRFMNDAAFRERAMPVLVNALDPSVNAVLRSACLRDLNEGIGLDFDAAETVAVSWGSAKWHTKPRHMPFTPGVLKTPDDLSPIETSIYSINSHFFTPDEARAFITAVRASAPKRRIVVLADAPMKRAFHGLNVDVAETFARFYTPWPRDPFLVARGANGDLVFVNRPNLQKDREEDRNMVRALVQGSFDALWTTATMPFHNGHVLLTPDAAWISIHTVELRALQFLGMDRVPVQTFHSAKGINAYLDAVRKAAKELETLYRRPVRFVHPLQPEPALMKKLAGGGSNDLDSMLTLLPQKDGKVVALVGDLSLLPNVGRKNAALQSFLDTIASHLASIGMTVRRLPLAQIEAEPKPYLLTWNNVVLEPGRAEGFASGNAEADAIARETFKAAGYELMLFPALKRSVELNGGYRCASNHVRR
jgi:hypothetical protein